MARANKFASVNLNDLYGKEDSAAKSARNSSGSAARLRGATHGGMLVLTRPVKQQGKIGGGHLGNLKKESGGSLGFETANNARGWTNSQQQVEPAHMEAIKEKSGDFPIRPLNPVTTFPTPTNSQSCTVQKDVVLRGEEFPTLQASLAPAIKNIEQLQVKDTHEKQDMHLDLTQQQERPVGSESQPTQSQLYRPPQLREDSHAMFIKAEKEIASSVQPLFTDPLLIRGNRAAEWADDERENGNRARPVGINTDQKLDSGNNQEAMLCLDMGGIYERDIISHPGSGGGRYGSEAISRPNSGGGRGRCGREAISRPGSGGGRYERLLISQPGSGGIEYNRPHSGGGVCEREIISQSNLGGSDSIRSGSAGINYGKNRPGSSSGRNEREVINPPGSGGSAYIHADSGAGRCEREIISQPGSGSSDNTRPGSGGSDYGRPRSAGIDSRMKRPGSGGSRYEYFQLGLGGGRYGREFISRPGSGGSDSIRPGSGGSDYTQQGLAGVDQCSPRDFHYNAQKNVDRGMANPHRSYSADVHHGWQNIHPTYESNRENGAHRDNWFRPGVALRELPKRDDHVKRGCNMEGYGGDGRYDYAPVECRQNFGQGTADGRFPEQPREREGAFGCSIGTCRDVFGGSYDDSLAAYNNFSRPGSGGNGALPPRPKFGDYGVTDSGKPLVYSGPSFDNECMHQDGFQSKSFSEITGKTSASDLWDHFSLRDSVDVVEDQRTIEVDVAKQDDRQDDESMEKVLASNGQLIRQVDFKEDVQCPWVEEKINYVREEEERKENAKKKLLELEERIAKRESQQKRNAEDIQQRKEQEIAEHA